MKRIAFVSLIVACAIAMGYQAAASVAPRTIMPPQGFTVLTKDDSGWVARATINYGFEFQNQSIDVSSYLPDADGEYKIRIKHGPEGMANLDSVTFGAGDANYDAHAIFDVASNEDLLNKLRASDSDVINAHSSTIEARFVVPGTKHTRTPLRLSIRGREEDPNDIPGGPCAYPSTLHPIDEHVASLTYRMGQNEGSLIVDGKLSRNDQLGQPLFESFTEPISGHPDGYTYGYVKNDDHFLYGAIDFTPDNTFDGLEDFGALLINTPQGWKRFQVSMGDMTWGKPGFTYTDKVGYQHKIYEFKIPLEELDLIDDDKSLEMKFLAYGTAACPNTNGVGISLGYYNPDPGKRLIEDTDFQQVMMQLLLNNGESSICVDTIEITGSGTGDEAADIQEVQLYKDVNEDGTLDAGDTLLGTGTFSADEGTVTIDITPDNGLAVGGNQFALIVYLIKPSTADDSTFRALIAADDDLTFGATGPVGCMCDDPGNFFTGAPVEGLPLTLRYSGAATVTTGTNNPGDGGVSSGQTGVPMLQLAISADDLENLDLDALTITDPAAYQNAAAITAVRLWKDNDGDGTVSSGDVQLNADQTFTVGSDTLELVSQVDGIVPASSTTNFLVTYDFATATPGLSYRSTTISTKIASWAKALATGPLSLAGCGGGGSNALTLGGAPAGFIFTDVDGNPITEASEGDIVQVRTVDKFLLLQFTMGSTSVSLDGAALGRTAGGTLVALNADTDLTMTLKGDTKAVSGISGTLTAFVPCSALHTAVRVCPNETALPMEALACTGEATVTTLAPTSGGYTFANTDRTGTDDCQVTGDASLFAGFFGQGATAYQIGVSGASNVDLVGVDSLRTVLPSSVDVQGGAKFLTQY